MPAERSVTDNTRLRLFKQESANDLSFIYYGVFSDRINDSLVPLAEVVIGNSKVGLKIRKRAFYIFVECIQNVNRHRSKEKRNKNFPREIFSIRQKDNRFNVAFGNVMNKSKEDALRSKIEELNETPVEELNLEYKRILRDTVLSKLGGAGLGLIEVARKSGNKIKYRFDDLDPDRSYFMMETNINEPNTGIDFPEFDGLTNIDLYKEVFNANSFGFVLKANNDSLLELKSRNLFSLMNTLDEKGFFRVKNFESYLGAIIELIVKNCTNKPLMQSGFIVKLEAGSDGKYLSFCWSGTEEQVIECAEGLQSSIKELNQGKGKPKGGSIKKFLELMTLLQYNSRKKIQLETRDYEPGKKFLIIRAPLD